MKLKHILFRILEWLPFIGIIFECVQLYKWHVNIAYYNGRYDGCLLPVINMTLFWNILWGFYHGIGVGLLVKFILCKL